MIDWQSIINKHGPIAWQTASRNVHLCSGSLAETAGAQFFGAVSSAGYCEGDRPAAPAISPFAALKDATDLAVVPSANPDPAQKAQTQELANRLREALAQLPPQEAHFSVCGIE